MRSIRLALGDIKLAHTVFALPFAILAAVLVRPRVGESGMTDVVRFAGQLGLVVVCMFFARTWAMLVNRLADAGFDSENPRTAKRVFAAGGLSKRVGWVIASGCAGAFWLAAGGFWLFFGNVWPALLAPVALVWIALYAYMKRLTALCHVFLGSALAISPLCAAVAVSPAQTVEMIVPLCLLAGFVMCWVAGFDIPYALADVEVDRRLGLRSVPAALGVGAALLVSRALHFVGACAMLGFVLVAPGLGTLSVVGAGAVAALLVYEHTILARRGVAGLPVAFFLINGVISVVFGLVASLDSML